MELEDSKAQEGFIQCVEMLPTSNDTEDLDIYEDKDGDWGGGASVTSATANPWEFGEGEGQDPPGSEGGTGGNLGTGLPQEQLEPRNPPVEGPRIQPAEPSPSKEEGVVSNSWEPTRNGENPTRDISKEPQVRDS